MTNKRTGARHSAGNPRRDAYVCTAPMVTLAAVLLLAACSRNADTNGTASAAPDTVTLTREQRDHVQLYKTASGTYRRTVEASGVVDFDNDQATSVLAPFSG